MKKIKSLSAVIALVCATSMLSGCPGAPEMPHRENGKPGHKQDDKAKVPDAPMTQDATPEAPKVPEVVVNVKPSPANEVPQQTVAEAPAHQEPIETSQNNAPAQEPVPVTVVMVQGAPTPVQATPVSSTPISNTSLPPTPVKPAPSWWVQPEPVRAESAPTEPVQETIADLVPLQKEPESPAPVAKLKRKVIRAAADSANGTNLGLSTPQRAKTVVPVIIPREIGQIEVANLSQPTSQAERPRLNPVTGRTDDVLVLTPPSFDEATEPSDDKPLQIAAPEVVAEAFEEYFELEGESRVLGYARLDSYSKESLKKQTKLAQGDLYLHCKADKYEDLHIIATAKYLKECVRLNSITRDNQYFYIEQFKCKASVNTPAPLLPHG